MTTGPADPLRPPPPPGPAPSSGDGPRSTDRAAEPAGRPEGPPGPSDLPPDPPDQPAGGPPGGPDQPAPGSTGAPPGPGAPGRDAVGAGDGANLRPFVAVAGGLGLGVALIVMAIRMSERAPVQPVVGVLALVGLWAVPTALAWCGLRQRPALWLPAAVVTAVLGLGLAPLALPILAPSAVLSDLLKSSEKVGGWKMASRTTSLPPLAR